VSLSRTHRVFAAALLVFSGAAQAHALEHVTLKNGFEYDCIRREVLGDKVRLYFGAGGANYLDIAADSVMRVETLPDPVPPAVVPVASKPVISQAEPTPAELTEMIGKAGAAHHIDADLLLSLVHAESGGHAHVVSRAGARGLMQLMPGTATALGVKDSFVPEQNVEGGTSYLDALLTRYKDNIALALAAYNAGPGAVDRYHGVPPFRETRAYVSRIIREFNRRKTMLLAQAPPAK
jgi:soluble lytic murein transglycosylase-like protein